LSKKQRLALPSAELEVDRFLEALAGAPVDAAAFRTTFSTEGHPARAAVVEAARQALSMGGGRAVAVLDAFGTTPGTFLPGLPQAAENEAVTEPLLATLLPELRAYVRHDNLAVRGQALALVGRIPGAEATAVLTQALTADVDSQRAAVAVLERTPRTDANQLAPALLAASKSADWSTRLAVARALGTQQIASPEVLARLRELAETDGFALVREGALLAVGRIDLAAGKKLGNERKSADKEPRVQTVAEALSRGVLP
jgi:HEAT repeat protein